MSVQKKLPLILVVLLISTGCTVSIAHTSPISEIYIDPSNTIELNKLQIGFQASFQSGNLIARSDIAEIYKGIKPKIIRIFDWRPEVEELDPCIYWDESRKSGSFDWRSVDYVIDTIFDMGAEPLICLGTSGPDYPPSSYGRRYLPNGMTLKSNLLPDYEQFASYCREWVRHFKQTNRPVRYYEIWNEAYGYFDWAGKDAGKLSNWMNLWIACEKEMSAENPNLLIGNDHTNMKNILETFIEKDANLGFISYHKYDTGSTSTSDSSLFRAAESQYLEETSTCYGTKRAQQRWYEVTGKLIPIIDSESNMNWDWQPTDPRLQQMSGAIWNALCLRKEILEGVDYHVYFDEYSYIQRSETISGFGMVSWDPEVKKWYPYYLYYWIGNNLAVGDAIVETTSSAENIRTLGWYNHKALNVLIIHKAREIESLKLTGLTGEFKYFKIDETVPYTDPSVQEGTLDVSENIVLNGYTLMLLQQEEYLHEKMFDDGFESGDFGAWSGLTLTSGDDATVTQASSCYGEYGAKFQTYSIASGIKRACVYRNIEESPVVYARGYFCIAEGLPLVDADDRFTLLHFLGSGGNWICSLQVRRVQGEDRFAIHAFTGDMQTTTAVYPTSDTWYCIELFAQIHATEGAFKAYIDGVERLSLTDIDTTMFGNILTIRFGLANSINVQHKVVVYGDKAVFSTSYNGLLYPWDLNKDRAVDLLDFTIVMSCYGATPESPRWNQLADLKVDGIIDVYDVVIVCYHYGEKY